MTLLHSTRLSVISSNASGASRRPPLRLRRKQRQGACESMTSTESMTSRETQPTQEDDPDMPAESFLLRIGEGIDWTDINALYERYDSTKGNTNPKSQHANPRQNQPSTSQRFSEHLKPKAPIIALPSKIHHAGHLGRSARRLSNALMFPEKSHSSVGKAAGPLSEPASPQVSCFGKVLTDSEREVDLGKRSGRGFWGRLVAAVGCGRPATRESREEGNRTSAGIEKTISLPGRLSATGLEEGDGIAAVPSVGLGAMKRFSSLRGSESWKLEEN
ncbi:hypothetical protein HPP92_006126 [Vanilla planifolia]|uniref:Uncharacterized protein n=1 Tax=Vanilla planifolia TaxID=51239 RepID=A0A835S022_VANPL|nr:hypothetical protein HPP92_006126 [Vanilla planifolia]